MQTLSTSLKQPNIIIIIKYNFKSNLLLVKKKNKTTLNICNYGSIILHSINNKLDPRSTFKTLKKKKHTSTNICNTLDKICCRRTQISRNCCLIFLPIPVALDLFLSDPCKQYQLICDILAP